MENEFQSDPITNSDISADEPVKSAVNFGYNIDSVIKANLYYLTPGTAAADEKISGLREAYSKNPTEARRILSQEYVNCLNRGALGTAVLIRDDILDGVLEVEPQILSEAAFNCLRDLLNDRHLDAEGVRTILTEFLNGEEKIIAEGMIKEAIIKKIKNCNWLHAKSYIENFFPEFKSDPNCILAAQENFEAFLKSSYRQEAEKFIDYFKLPIETSVIDDELKRAVITDLDKVKDFKINPNYTNTHPAVGIVRKMDQGLPHSLEGYVLTDGLNSIVDKHQLSTLDELAAKIAEINKPE
ncbi:MAG: hypothetical protein WC227_00990 [Patescibacteria group bacterium]